MNRRLAEQITTTRLRLRKPELADAASIFHAYAQDLDVSRYMTWTPLPSESVTRAFVESCIEAWDGDRSQPFIITLRDSDVAIGMIEARALGTTIDIGYVLAKPHWGAGLMPEAIAALAGSALDSPAIFRVQATCDTDNIGSQRALEKSGFTREGRLERHAVHPNISPEPRACFMYARCR
jgi:ribosomal-protein-alanine N-acetyltransferase